MKTVSIFTLRDNLAQLLDGVASTQSVLIVNRRKKPIAMIVPYKQTAETENFDRFIGFLRDDANEGGEAFVNRVRRSKKEKQRTQKLRERT